MSLTPEFDPHAQHNKGQEDAAAGKYDPPEWTVADTLEGEEGRRQFEERTDAYDKGHDNVSKEK